VDVAVQLVGGGGRMHGGGGVIRKKDQRDGGKGRSALKGEENEKGPDVGIQTGAGLGVWGGESGSPGEKREGFKRKFNEPSPWEWILPSALQVSTLL